jgi:hypothetical protein
MAATCAVLSEKAIAEVCGTNQAAVMRLREQLRGLGELLAAHHHAFCALVVPRASNDLLNRRNSN